MLNTIYAQKQDMKQWFSPEGRRMGVTILAVTPMKVSSHRTAEKNGYTATQFDLTTQNRGNKATKHEVRHQDADLSSLEAGSEIKWEEIFKAGDKVRVTGVSKGKGFSGVVKRYGFAGGPRTHGQSDRERAPGSIGSTTTPGRVLPGKKMAGRMGNETISIKNLEVVAIYPETKQIWVSGPVPGAKQGLVTIAKI